jgi:aspartoacylase
MNENTKIKNVAIVGGTHGNELTGVNLYHNRQINHNLNFEQTWVLANPRAVKEDRRYVEKDLNRCFALKDLDSDTPGYDQNRAREISAMIGPKENPKCQLTIDIHNTTANMGVTLIVSRLDAFMKWVLSGVLENEETAKVYVMEEGDRLDSPYLPSLTPYDICLEVGAQAHGTLDAELYFKTKKALETMLQRVHDWNNGNAKALNKEFPVYLHLENLDYPRNSEGEISGMIHPERQFQDYQEVQKDQPLFVTFDEKILNWQGSAKISAEQSVWPVFINEHAYYEKKLAMSLTQKKMIEF